MGLGQIGFGGSSAYPKQGVQLLNQTGQTLYPGNVVEIDELQSSSASQPAAGNAANPVGFVDSLNIGLGNGVLATFAGLAAGVKYAFVSSPSAVAPGAPFTAQCIETAGAVQVNPLYSQVLTITGSPTGGSLIFSVSNSAGVSAATATFSSTVATTLSNLTTAFAGATGVGTNNVFVSNTGTYSFTISFSPSATTSPGLTTITGNGLTGGTSPAATIAMNPTGIVAGTKLTPVAGQTYLAPTSALAQQQLLTVVSAPTSFALTVTNSAGAQTAGTVTYSATAATLASNIATALGALTGFSGTTANAIGGQILVTFPPSAGPMGLMTVPNYYGGTLPSINIGEYNSTISQGSIVALALEAVTPTVVSGNFGAQLNQAPSAVPSAAGAANPAGYSYPQYLLRCDFNSLYSRGNTGAL